MRAHLGAIVAASVLLCITSASSRAADETVDAATRSVVIERVLNGLDRSYVFPEVARQMREAVQNRVREGEYESVTGAQEFANKLTADLQAISRDKHLRVRLSGGSGGPTVMRRGGIRQTEGEGDGGFAKVELMPGNVGYIDLRGFLPPHAAAEHAALAMNKVADADALIIDLRKNGGGSAEMVALLVSYLLEPEAILVNTFVGRDGTVTNETWTTKDLPGRRFAKDVYVLTSGFTFSAAEEFAYDVKNLKRATIVGETTGGGANPVDIRRINDQFEVSVPVARAVNPITKTNWEGVGVSPDVNVSAEMALKTAHVTALKNSAARSSDSQTKQKLSALIAEIEQRAGA